MQEFLRSTDVIDWQDPEIRDLACALAIDNDLRATAAKCFRWVRDEISHSFDANATCVSCSASETLRNRTGICYAKSHLLAALLRANKIPAAFGYQRILLDDAGAKFCLHGFNYVHLEHFEWYAIDPRGNRDGLATCFDPPRVSLAFQACRPGERTMKTIFADPLGCIVGSLQTCANVDELRSSLPDFDE